MPQYLLAVHHDFDAALPPDMDMEKAFRQVEEFNTALTESGSWVFGGGLMPPQTATVVDAVTDKPVVTDGPYLEAKEHLGGFWVVRAANLDEALEWARKGSAACMRPVEVRPLQDEE